MTLALDGVSGQSHAPAALHVWGKNSGTHWTGGWEGLRPRLDTATGKIPSGVHCIVIVASTVFGSWPCWEHADHWMNEGSKQLSLPPTLPYFPFLRFQQTLLSDSLRGSNSHISVAQNADNYTSARCHTVRISEKYYFCPSTNQSMRRGCHINLPHKVLLRRQDKWLQYTFPCSALTIFWSQCTVHILYVRVCVMEPMEGWHISNSLFHIVDRTLKVY
jgi:hypothetical protein